MSYSKRRVAAETPGLGMDLYDSLTSLDAITLLPPFVLFGVPFILFLLSISVLFEGR
ncbi:hypothetical protein BDV38DRAFT_235329 [Aspergillus pseudotamarii]|uniref:Uncharacterized protein n=1 Tax=Aspergillus pseudotamarii TaxID=132259 RepID=A0A5N6T8X0_ASPPS|nr:uncharacterized protein BDV38DRAFT_235329 [Aspergillus pseudotamarii]KAE8142621.1 hypothetical protein BDV38DRAFT_235329 [Aspergillus pseudotamarii]